MSSLISSVAWVRRGFPAEFPKKYNLDEAEYERIAALTKTKVDDAKEALEQAQEQAKKATEDLIIEDELAEYNLEDYDKEEEQPEEVGEAGAPMALFGNAKGLAFHQSNEEDAYITLQDVAADEDAEERADLQILPTDNLILTAKTEDDLSHLEVYVYEDEEANLYVHHDIMLPAFPLCIEPLDYPVGRQVTEDNKIGNFVAIGTFEPDIEIWDLDVVDGMYPNAILGQGGPAGAAATGGASDATGKKKKKKSKKQGPNSAYHVDAVLTLSSAPLTRNLLASGSADTTIKLWDLNTCLAASSYNYHTDKVGSIAFHRAEAAILLTGSYDRTVAVADLRITTGAAGRWGVESDVENVAWNPHDPNGFFVGTDSGMVHYFDVRNIPKTPAQSKPLWSLQAHDSQPVSTLAINNHIPGLFATGSTDKMVKVWNVPEATGSGPRMVVSRDLGVGKVFSASWGPDAEVAFRLGVAGSKGVVQVWDASTNAGVRRAFEGRVAAPVAEYGEDRTVGVVDDDEEESDDEEGEEGVEIPMEEGDDEDLEGEDEDDDEEDHPEGWESMDEQ